MEITDTTVTITSKNDVSNDTFKLHITLLNQEHGISVIVYFGFIMFIGIALIGVQIRTRREQKEIVKLESKL